MYGHEAQTTDYR